MPDRRDVTVGVPGPEPTPRRGRPPVISREMIVDAALVLVRQGSTLAWAPSGVPAAPPRDAAVAA